jgi:hypothetical protein
MNYPQKSLEVYANQVCEASTRARQYALFVALGWVLFRWV